MKLVDGRYFEYCTQVQPQNLFSCGDRALTSFLNLWQKGVFDKGKCMKCMYELRHGSSRNIAFVFFYRIYSLRTSLVEYFREESALRRAPEKQLRNFCMNYGLIFFLINLLLCSIFDHVSTEGRKINFLFVHLNVAC